MTFRKQLAAVAIVSMCLTSTTFGWSVATNISGQPAGSRAFGPKAVVDSANNVHVVWAGGVDPAANWKVYYQVFDGSTWTSPVALSAAGGSNPGIAIDGFNNVHVVYDLGNEVYYIKQTSGVWGASTNLSNNASKSVIPAVAASKNGATVIVSWADQGGAGATYDIYSRKFSAGAWAATVNLSNDSTLSNEPSMRADAAGNLYTLWSDDGTDEIYMRKHNTGGVWEAEVRIDTTASRSTGPDMCVTGNGNLHVTWLDDTTGNWEIYHRFYNGTTWSTPVNVSNHVGVTDAGPSIACNSAGDIRISYHDYADIYYVKQIAGVWQAPTMLNNATTQNGPSLVVDYKNRETCVWQLSNGTNWNIYHSWQGAAYNQKTRDTYADGDHQSDLAVVTPTTTLTWNVKSSDSFWTTSASYVWGSVALGDTALDGDYDGDGKTDPTVYRPAASSTFIVLKSTSGYTTSSTYTWGSSTLGDIPVLGDYDGDRITDIVVWRPGATATYFVKTSTSGFLSSVSYNVGTTGDIRIGGDFDGDGKADPGVWRPGATGQFIYLKSASGYTSSTVNLGTTGDLPMTGDFDNDGKSDLAVYHPGEPSTWTIKLSSSGFASSVSYGWGSASLADVPLTGDYDGDGRADISVYRPGASGIFYILTSSSNFTLYWPLTWGTTGSYTPGRGGQQPLQ